MSTRTFYRWIALALCAAAAVAGAQEPVGGNKACALVTPSELETAVGGKVSLSAGGGTPPNGAEICRAETATVSVLLRVVKRSGGSDADKKGGAEKAGIDMARKMGAQVDVKTFGDITCSTVVPPADLAKYGFNTTCAITTATAVAAIEVTAKNQKDMVPIERLRPLAEKMATRL